MAGTPEADRRGSGSILLTVLLAWATQAACQCHPTHARISCFPNWTPPQCFRPLLVFRTYHMGLGCTTGDRHHVIVPQAPLKLRARCNSPHHSQQLQQQYQLTRYIWHGCAIGTEHMIMMMIDIERLHSESDPPGNQWTGKNEGRTRCTSCTCSDVGVLKSNKVFISSLAVSFSPGTINLLLSDVELNTAVETTLLSSSVVTGLRVNRASPGTHPPHARSSHFRSRPLRTQFRDGPHQA